MCLAIPNKIISIENNWATVASENHKHKVNLSLVKNVKVGDFVLSHGNMAINKIPINEAKKILKIINQTKKDFNKKGVKNEKN